MIELQSKMWLSLFFTLTLVVIANSIGLSFLPKLWTYMDILTIQNIKNGALETDFKTKRFNRTTLVICGTFTINEDLSNIDFSMKFFFSPLGNNQFMLIPYMWRREPLCDFFNKSFQKNIQPGLEKVSDVPKAVKGQPVCPLYVKKTYTIEEYYLPEDMFPHHFQPGSYRCDIHFYKANGKEIQETMVVVVKLY
ncbi:uncharacterized protein LOC119076151 [Bradysia coprophila]|uniref:uncharacterized protein LOC119076151 n=1 Tax=Bradysia coprophila TaxID=38358 RepID=UPI00187D79D2|nr:uncharacterized protein LOC119076151 [Bradysia coprophila]